MAKFINLSMDRRKAIEITERTTSVMSLLGTLFIFATFISFRSLRKPINRLIFFASFGNILSNVATLISTSGMQYGESSALCQFQGFMIQMFMPADALWAFCMAFNVWLTFFKNYNPQELRKFEKWYMLICYGIPLLPAVAFLCISTLSQGTPIFGDALIWCWIRSDPWDWLRVLAFYGPVWLIILTTFSIYAFTGKEIFKQRAALRAFSKQSHEPAARLNPFVHPDPTVVTRITEIHVVSEARPRSLSIDKGAKDSTLSSEARSSFSSSRGFSFPAPGPEPTQGRRSMLGILGTKESKSSKRNCAAGNCTTTVSVGPQTVGEEEEKTGMSRTRNPSSRKSSANTSAAWGYAKVAILMFVAALVVWVPSTANRMYGITHGDAPPNFPLLFLASAVLPLQGFWNFIIYTTTSWTQIKASLGKYFSRNSHSHPHHPNSGSFAGSPHNNGSLSPHATPRGSHFPPSSFRPGCYDNSSATYLATQHRRHGSRELTLREAMDLDPDFDYSDADGEDGHPPPPPIPWRSSSYSSVALDSPYASPLPSPKFPPPAKEQTTRPSSPPAAMCSPHPKSTSPVRMASSPVVMPTNPLRRTEGGQYLTELTKKEMR